MVQGGEDKFNKYVPFPGEKNKFLCERNLSINQIIKKFDILSHSLCCPFTPSAFITGVKLYSECHTICVTIFVFQLLFLDNLISA